MLPPGNIIVLLMTGGKLKRQMTSLDYYEVLTCIPSERILGTFREPTLRIAGLENLGTTLNRKKGEILTNNN